ncbi:BBE domain-containing protein [Microbacterium lacticum]|uniref:BBE domain-containing protein n=1 Tax=Microbacterium lacticum TaxID=33885 RepID=UPI003A886F5A
MTAKTQTAPPDGGERLAISRRGLVTGALGVGLATLLTPGAATAQPLTAPAATRRSDVPVIRRGRDPQYESTIAVYNRRIRANPYRVFAPRTGAETVTAVQRIIDSGERLSVISGGHCFEDFSLPADVNSVVHVGALNSVNYNADVAAYSVGSGARLLNVYENLFRDAGVTIPGGVCYSVGVGGHVTGGGYGLLSRVHGLTVDHLVGVEVVTVDRRGQASLNYVTRRDTGDKSDLFWAHTGGGGGNFGVVTRFDFRKAQLDRGLPAPPSSVHLVTCGWPWDGVSEEQFEAFLTVFADWCVTHRASDTITNQVFPWLIVRHRDYGGLGMVMQVAADEALPAAKELVADLASALRRTATDEYVSWTQMPWMNAGRLVGTSSAENHNPNRRGKQGSANLRQRLSSEQTAHLYRAMNSPIRGSVSAGFDIAALGGAISDVASDATAVYQRDSVMKLLVQTFWASESDDAPNLEWLRSTYHGLFAGGAPGYDRSTAGSYINYPNTDLSDPAWNTSGMGAGEIYYGRNYARLQRAKRRWDPNDYFRHSQSVKA